MSPAVKIALLPLLVAQGVWARARTPKLPEAEGDRHGAEGEGVEPLRLLIVGDSSAAGVGVTHQRDGFSGQFSSHLARELGRRVHWQLVARSGVNSTQALALVRAHAVQPADVGLVVLGVNDVVDQVAVPRAIAAREALADALLSQHGLRHVAFTALPPMDRFTALPQPLRAVAGADARRHDQALRRWAQAREAERGDVSYLPLGVSLEPEHLAHDRFHPSAAGYRLCCGVIAEHLAAHLARRRPAVVSPAG